MQDRMLQAMQGHGCTSGPCDHPPDDPIYLGDPLPGGQWSTCPAGQLRNPLLSAVIHLDNCAHISPLCGWPDTYAAGVVDCLIALRLERAEYHAEQMRRANEQG